MGGEYILPFVDGQADLFAFSKLEQHADPEALIALVKEFVCTVRVNGEETIPAMFDMKYTGELWEVVQLFAFVHVKLKSLNL